MPEGDVVWRVSRQLDAALAGRTLTRSDFRVPRFATRISPAGPCSEALVARQAHPDQGRRRPHDPHAPADGRVMADQAGRSGSASRSPDPSGARERAVAGGRLPARRRRGAGDRAGGSRRSATWGPTCSGRTGTRPRPSAGCGPSLTGQSARRCSTSGTWPASGTCTRPRCCSCAASARGSRSARPPSLSRSSTSLRRLLEANKERVGQVTTGNPARGQETWVYGRAGRPCRRCGTRVAGRRLRGAWRTSAGTGDVLVPVVPAGPAGPAGPAWPAWPAEPSGPAAGLGY